MLQEEIDKAMKEVEARESLVDRNRCCTIRRMDLTLVEARESLVDRNLPAFSLCVG